MKKVTISDIGGLNDEFECSGDCSTCIHRDKCQQQQTTTTTTTTTTTPLKKEEKESLSNQQVCFGSQCSNCPNRGNCCGNKNVWQLPNKLYEEEEKDFVSLPFSLNYKCSGNCEDCPNKGKCTGNCEDCPMKGKCGGKGGCANCPNKGKCGKKGNCANCPNKEQCQKNKGCTGNCENCPNKGKCSGNCEDCPMKGKCGGKGGCANCPNKGKCGKKGNCENCPNKAKCQKNKGCTGNCENCPNKGKCGGKGGCENCPNKGKCGGKGGCDNCPNKGKCGGNCDNCPMKGKCKGCPNKGGNCANCPNKGKCKGCPNKGKCETCPNKGKCGNFNKGEGKKKCTSGNIGCVGGGKKKHSEVEEFYSKALKTGVNQQRNIVLKDYMSSFRIKTILGNISYEVLKRNFGCGSPIPQEGWNMDGLSVLDLGSGAGRDTFICAALVGKNGKSIGVDMTQSAIDFSKSQIEYHEKQFNKEFPKTGCGKIEFHQSYIEQLKPIQDNSMDLIISNCVINLSPNKPKVIKSMFRVLKEGGEVYFSDIFADRRVPMEFKNNSSLWGKCISGAMYINDFINLIKEAGFKDFRIVASRKKLLDVDLLNKKENEKFKNIGFYSLTVRFFKNKNISEINEDFGQTATYLGGLSKDSLQNIDLNDKEDYFFFDKNNIFHKGEKTNIGSNTATILSQSRYSKLFKISEKLEHQGEFFEKSPFQIVKETKEAQVGCGSDKCCQL